MLDVTAKIADILTDTAEFFGLRKVVPVSDETVVLKELANLSKAQETDSIVQEKKNKDLASGRLVPSEARRALYLIQPEWISLLPGDSDRSAKCRTGAALTTLWKHGFIAPVFDEKMLEERIQRPMSIAMSNPDPRYNAESSLSSSLYVYLYGPPFELNYTGQWELFNHGADLCNIQHAAILKDDPPWNNILGWEITQRGEERLRRQENSKPIDDLQPNRSYFHEHYY